VEKDMTDKAPSGSRYDPSAAGALAALVDSFPGKLGNGAAVAGAIANVEPSLHGDESHLAFLTVECNEARFDEINRVFNPTGPSSRSATGL
jgi:hypothetical protein